VIFFDYFHFPATSFNFFFSFFVMFEFLASFLFIRLRKIVPAISWGRGMNRQKNNSFIAAELLQKF